MENVNFVYTDTYNIELEKNKIEEEETKFTEKNGKCKLCLHRHL